MGFVKRERPAGIPGPKPMVDEWRFVPDSLDEARQLYRVMVDAGTPHTRARQIVAWLIVLTPDRADDPTSDMARRDFRRALAALGAPPWEIEQTEAAAGVG